MPILDAVTIGPLNPGDTYVYTFPFKPTKPDYVIPTTNTSISATTMTNTSVTFENVGASQATATFLITWFFGEASRDANYQALELGWNGANAGSVSAGQNLYIDVTDYGAVGDGVTDNFAAFTSALLAADLAGKGIWIPDGDYLFSKAVILDGIDGMQITGSPTAKIIFPSSDTSLTGGGNYDANPVNERSAFYIKDCSRIVVQQLLLEGDSTETDITVNTGLAFACGTAVGQLFLLDVDQDYGGGLVSQADDAATWGAVVFRCKSYGSRGNSRLGNGGTFHTCEFELPTDASYDRVGSDGSSHAIYFFASSGDLCSVINTVFRSIRLDPVKVSGSASPSTGYIVSHCRMYDCRSVSTFGADDSQEHNLIQYTNNQHWNSAGVSILGSRNVNVSHNQWHFTAALPAGALSGAISVYRYTTTSQPVESVIVDHNIFTGDESLSAANVITTALVVSNVGSVNGFASIKPSSVQITNNYFGPICLQGMSVTNCVHPRISFNTFTGVTTAMNLQGNRCPWISYNDILGAQSNNAQIRLNSDAWPIVYGNVTGNRLTSVTGKASVNDNNGGSAAVKNPLLGKQGYVTPSEGKPEVVLAYGGGWTDGDTVNVNGTTYTYKTTGPTGSEFNSAAGLIALIDAQANFDCADYGTPWGVTSNHLRIRYATANTTRNLFYVETTTARPTAGVVLSNNTTANPQRCYSRGEGVDNVVCWSPLWMLGYDYAQMFPLNAAAQTALATPPLMKDESGVTPIGTDVDYDTASCAEMVFASALAGTEEFIFVVPTA